jgi:hypothetical protein
MMWLLLSACWLMAGCSVIDDDLSDCNQGEEYKIDYELRLITNMTTELETQLTTITEMGVAESLREHLKDIFSDFAHDIDLSFYDTEGDMTRLHHKRDIIDANQTSYTLTLPMQEYMHLAVANIAENKVVGLSNDENCQTSMLQQTDDSPIASHTTGLFTARLPMEVLSGVSQTFNVKLYMANSAVALVLDTKGHAYSEMKVYATGFAKEFMIEDSTYVFPEKEVLVRADKVETGNDLLCFCSVNFPSHNPDEVGADEPLWQLRVYVTMPDGNITETIIDVKEQLKAGELKIIKGELDDEGAVRPYDSTVGVSVTLDWNEGGTYDPEL